jgi:hypothetical protein
MDQTPPRAQPTTTNDTDCAYIAAIESWGSGGQMLDVVTLTDGKILVITERDIVLYPDRETFEEGVRARTLSRNEPQT